MTTFDDFDRRLAQFLDEGPARSPDRPVDAAIAHALAHPRRRDPFAPLRRDPMARPAAWSSRPVLVFAVLGLLLVMAAAVFVVGSPRQPSVVPPTADPTASPSAPVSPAPSPTPVAPREISVEVTDGNGRTKTLVIVDESGLLENAFAWEVQPDRRQNGEVEITQLPADEGGGMDGLVVHWVHVSCVEDYRLTIDEAARHLVIDAPFCEADSIPVDHAVLLDFAEPVPAEGVTGRLVQEPAP